MIGREKMKKNLTLKNLDKFGLNSYEAKGYLSLLEKNQLTATEVSRLADIPRARVYETLENLEKRGFCRKIPGKIKMYTAVDPSLLKETLIQTEKVKLEQRIQNLKDQIKKEEKQLGERIKDAENLADRLAPIYKDSRSKDDSIDYIELIKDNNQMQKRVCQLIESTEKGVIAMSKPPKIEDRQIVLEQLDFERESIARGTYGKCIYEIPENIDKAKWLREYAGIVSDIGEDVKIIEKLPIKFLIFDEKTVIFQLEDPISFKPASTSLVVHHRSFALSLKLLFENIWEKALSLDELDKIIEKRQNEILIENEKSTQAEINDDKI